MPKKLTKQEFIEKSKNRHSVAYDYSKVEYFNNRTQIKIGCKIHGWFSQSPADHLAGKGCGKCAGKNVTQDEAIEKLKKIHGNKYNYDNLNYTKANEEIVINCKKHGEFEQLYCNHLKGQGCPKCKTFKKLKTFEKFVEQSNVVHNNLYEYFEYKGDNEKINIKCRKHGIFKQTPTNHLQNHGCPRCISIISKPEIQVQDFLKYLNLEIQTNKRGIIGRKELDIYIPSLKKAIEFNGTYWHYSKKHFVPGKHSIKSKLCREKGIRLLYVREDLWLKNKDKMKYVIQKFLEDEK